MPRTKGSPNKKRSSSSLGILSRPLSFRLPKPVYEDLMLMINREGMAVSEFLENVVTEYCESRRKDRTITQATIFEYEQAS